MHTLPCVKQITSGNLLCDRKAARGSVTAELGQGAVGGGLHREGAQACITVQQKFLEKQLYSPKFIFYKKKLSGLAILILSFLILNLNS